MTANVNTALQVSAIVPSPVIDWSRIRCVAFDAVGTLIYPSPPAAEVYFQAARRHGSQLSADEVANRFRQAFRETEHNDETPDDPWATNELRERERWRTIVSRVIDDIAEPEACFVELFAWFARPDAWGVFDDVPETLAALAKRGIGVALASNFDRRLHAVCNALPMLAGIGLRVVSSEAGFRKPSPNFFEALLQSAQCQPSELLMVGDDRENDLEGAAQLGIPGVLIDRREAAPIGSLRRLTDLFAAEFGWPA